MGSRSSTQANQQTATTNTQEIKTTTVGIEDSDNAIVGGAGDISLVYSDMGAIDAASDIADSAIGLGGEAIQLTGRTTEASLDFARDFGGDALEAVQANTSQAINTLGTAITQAADASRSDTTETFRRITLYAAIAVTVIFVAMQFRKRG
jgi:hypothetical protein